MPRVWLFGASLLICDLMLDNLFATNLYEGYIDKKTMKFREKGLSLTTITSRGI